MARKGFNGLSKYLNKVEENLEKNIDKLMSETAITIGTTVILATPVDTGLARNSWLAEVDKESTEKGEQFNLKRNKTRSEKEAVKTIVSPQTIENLKQKVSDFKSSKINVMNITNNANYIGCLNDGSSEQAKAGFVQTAINAAINEVKRVRGLTNG